MPHTVYKSTLINPWTDIFFKKKAKQPLGTYILLANVCALTINSIVLNASSTNQILIRCLLGRIWGDNNIFEKISFIVAN